MEEWLALQNAVQNGDIDEVERILTRINEETDLIALESLARIERRLRQARTLKLRIGADSPEVLNPSYQRRFGDVFGVVYPN